jgi:PhnB protein
MTEQVKAVPPGFHTLTAHLTVRNADEALEFYKKAFGAEVLHVSRMPDGKIMHASLRIGDSMLMVNEEMPEYGALSPLSTGGSGVTLHLYTENVDGLFDRAVADPYGFRWSIAAHVKEMSPEEMQQAQDETFGAMKKTA